MGTASIISRWHFDPLILLLTALITAGYYFLSRFNDRRSNRLFITAIAIFLLVECSPLHYLGMNYYFSIHMATHILALLVCGPLLVMSISRREILFRVNGVKRVCVFFYRHSWLCWLAGVGVMWLWHIPAIFDAGFAGMQASFSLLPVVHAASILLGGVLFSLPLFGPYAGRFLHPLAGVVYLFTACVTCSLLGLLITFAPVGTYRHYALMSAAAGLPPNPWHIPMLQDQQAAGLIMWVPCCFIYLGGAVYLLARWFSQGSISLPMEQPIHTPQIITNHDRK